MFDKIVSLLLVILSSFCVYVTVLCYTSLSNYDAKIKSLEVIIKDVNDNIQSLHEEDLVILRLIDEQNKHLKAQDEQIRIQNVLINEARAKRKK